MRIEGTLEVTSELTRLWESSLKGLLAHRGGPQFLVTEMGGRDRTELLSELVADAGVFVAWQDQTAIGFIVVSRGVIEGLYVERSHRRQGVGRALVTHLNNSKNPPRDAHVLPGDRAMKSLFESFGWKARLLTMCGE